MSERREGKSRLVYNKETRTIDTVRTPLTGDMVLVPREPTAEMCEAGWIDTDNVTPRDIYIKMLAASPLPTQEVSDGWRDIKTDPPPKDGTLILACNTRGIVPHTAVVGWDTRDDAPVWSDNPISGTALEFNSDYFNLWRPLPTPPESALRTGERKE